MAIERLPALDGIGSLAVAAKTLVYTDSRFPYHLRGLSDYSPTGHYFIITLNPALDDDLEPVFYHECAHCRLGHVNTTAGNQVRAASYHKLVKKMGVLAENETFYETVGQVRMEEEAETMARWLRCQWPFSGYRLWRLIQEKEVFPWQLYTSKL